MRKITGPGIVFAAALLGATLVPLHIAWAAEGTWHFSGMGRDNSGEETSVDIYIARQGQGYVVTGRYGGPLPDRRDMRFCDISGTYFPQTSHMKGRCQGMGTYSFEGTASNGVFDVIVAGNHLTLRDANSPPEARGTQDQGSTYIPSACEQVPATWSWAYGSPLEVHGAVTFQSDGTQSWSGDGRHGTWVCSGSTVTLTWPGYPFVDTLTMRADRQTMDGGNNQWTPIQATR